MSSNAHAQIVIISAGVISGLGDVIAQQVVERRSLREHDWSRTFRFSTIGLVIVVSLHKLSCTMTILLLHLLDC